MKKMNKKEVIREIFSYINTILLAMVITWLVCSKIVTHAQVPTGSMEDTIMTGSRVIINRIAYLTQAPRRGDIVAFDYPDDETQRYLKRIIGLPGEIIEGKDGKVYIDGEELSEPYIREVSYMDFGPYVIPEDSYFMMGDNRNNSWDSRYWTHTFVMRDAIVGQVKIELYPQIKLLE